MWAEREVSLLIISFTLNNLPQSIKLNDHDKLGRPVLERNTFDYCPLTTSIHTLGTGRQSYGEKWFPLLLLGILLLKAMMSAITTN